MSSRIRMSVNMKLLSDTLFYAGFSVLGGESLAPVRDGVGYPYMKAATLKDLLRKSVGNVLMWHGAQDCREQLFGGPGELCDSPRAVRVVQLRLCDPPADPGECFVSRAFIKVSHTAGNDRDDGNGLADTALRTVMAARKGLEFVGWVDCAREDEALIRESFAAIKWAGKLFHQGMGRVQFVLGPAQEDEVGPQSITGPCACIHYRLYSRTPIQIRSLHKSSDRYKETRDYIPGSAIRGMVMERLAAHEPEWFAAHKERLLSDRVRFLDALPNPAGLPAIPVLNGFYEKKDGSCFTNVVKTGRFDPGSKRADLGRFCALQDGEVLYWTPLRNSILCTDQTKRRETFTTLHLNEGQYFDGYILIDEEELSPAIGRAFGREIRVGANRNSGFGQCAVECVECMEEPAVVNAYGCAPQDRAQDTLYMAALSPLSMINEMGEPCGLDLKVLARKLGVEWVRIDLCSSGLEEMGGYNRTWGCHVPLMTMYRPGSVFRLRCSEPVSPECLRQIQWEGLGERRAEGCGQVLFLREDLFASLTGKRELEVPPSDGQKLAAEVRRKKYRWIRETEAGKIASLRLDTDSFYMLQRKCREAAARKDSGYLRAYLDSGKGWKREELARLYRAVLDATLEETLGTAVPSRTEENALREKLELLCLLSEYSGSAADRRRGKRNG